MKPRQLQLGPLARPASVAVVIPARDAGSSLPQAVSSALGQAVEGELEVVVAVGPSDDDTAEVAAALAASDRRVGVVANPSGTTPSGLNRAIAATAAPVIVRLDAHAELPPGYVQRAIEVLAETGAANVGGRQVPIATDGFARAVAAAMASPLGAGGARYRIGGAAGPVETVYLGVFRAEALAAVGGFDERLIRNQDFELNHRLRTAGGTVYFHPDLAVRYTPRASVRGLARQYHDYGRWKRAVLRLHPGSFRPRQLAPLVLVGGLAGSLAAATATRRWWIAGSTSGAYTGLLLAGGARAAGMRHAAATALALAIMHLSWALGFVRGGVRLPPARH